MERAAQWARNRDASREVTHQHIRGIGMIVPKRSRGRVIARPHRSSHSHAPDVIQRALEQTVGTCYLCHLPLHVGDMHMEHIIPIARGGTDDETNLAAACAPCNTIKGDRYVAFTVASRKAQYVPSR